MTIEEFLFGQFQGVTLAFAFVAALIVAIVALVVAVALAPKPVTPSPAALEDFDFPQAEDGKDASLVFGDCWIEDPNVLWYGDLSSRAIKSKSK